MPSRDLPNSIPKCMKALKAAAFKHTNTTDPADKAFPDSLKTAVDTMIIDLATEVGESDSAIGSQVDSTREYETARAELYMFASHFFQVFHLGVERGEYTPGERTMFGMDANQKSIPSMTREEDLEYWTDKIAAGEALRIASGKTAVPSPTAAQVAAKRTTYDTKKAIQTSLKDATQKEDRDIKSMLPAAIALVKDVWDNVEFFFRYLDNATTRRRAREWGVVYTSRSGEPEEYLELVLPISSTVNAAGIDVNKATQLIIDNGLAQAEVCRQADATTTCGGSGTSIAPNTITTINMIDVVGTGDFLNFTNLSATLEGMVKITVVY